MKVLITGGGTGGHIYPALAIAKKIKEDYSDSKILYVGTRNSMESEIIPKEGFEFQAIRVKGFARKLSFDTLKSLKEVFLGLNDARKVIKDFSPNIVIGTGGYVCGPVVLTASLKGIPTLIHEQNALPGITNKILSRFVDKVALSFEESKKHFKNHKKLVITGNPIRESILNINKNESYKSLNISPNKKVVLSFGGSWGQKKLNEAMLRVIEKNVNNRTIQVIHVTGKRLYEDFMKGLKSKGIDISLNENITVVPYLFEMPKAQAISDLVIISAGAISIAEVTAIGSPCIVIPKSYTTDNHQEFNARAVENNGAGIMILEKDLDGNRLNTLILDLLNDKKRLDKMAVNSRKLGKVDATRKIVKIITNLADR